MPPTVSSIPKAMQVAMGSSKVIFLILFLLFLNKVIDSCIKWNRGDIGTFKKKAQVNVKFC